jgi:hypothetical protein
MRRHATRALVLTSLAALAASLVMIGAGGVAVAGRAPKPCAKATVDFFPKRVTAGQAMDLDFSLTNCSARDERLLVKLSPKGPCPFMSPSRQWYDLGPGDGVGQSGLFTAPDCPGHYRLKVQVKLGHRHLDRVRARFTVLK